MIFFSGEEPTPSTTPNPVDAHGASPLLPEILNTPLFSSTAAAAPSFTFLLPLNFRTRPSPNFSETNVRECVGIVSGNLATDKTQRTFTARCWRRPTVIDFRVTSSELRHG